MHIYFLGCAYPLWHKFEHSLIPKESLVQIWWCLVFLRRFPKRPASSSTTTRFSWFRSSTNWRCCGSMFGALIMTSLIDFSLYLPWNFDEIKLAIHFRDCDLLVVHTLVGVHYDWLSRSIHTHTKLVVSCVGIHWDFVHRIFLNCGDLRVDAIVAQFHCQRLGGVVDNLCGTHFFLWISLPRSGYGFPTFTQTRKK